MNRIALIQTAAEAALIALCALTAALIATDPAIRARRSRILAAPFALFALGAAAQMADTFRLFAALPALAGGVYAAVALIPAAVYLAIRRLAWPAAPAATAWHLAPGAAAGLGLALLFAAEGLAAPGPIRAKALFWAAFCLLSVAYLVAGVREIRAGFHRLRNLFSFRGGPAERGLDFALLLLAVPLAALAAGAMAPLGDPARLGFGLFRMACVATLAALALRPQAFLAAEPPPTGAPAGGAYARSGLDAAGSERIASKLAEAMRTGMLHRDPFLTRDALADRIGAPPQRVSQVLNQTLGVSFFDFVNACRIDEARRLLDAEPERPVAEIAAAVGFNSRSTFHAAFRKHVGGTPAAWRRRTATASPEADPAR